MGCRPPEVFPGQILLGGGKSNRAGRWAGRGWDVVVLPLPLASTRTPSQAGVCRGRPLRPGIGLCCGGGTTYAQVGYAFAPARPPARPVRSGALPPILTALGREGAHTARFSSSGGRLPSDDAPPPVLAPSCGGVPPGNGTPPLCICHPFGCAACGPPPHPPLHAPCGGLLRTRTHPPPPQDRSGAGGAPPCPTGGVGPPCVIPESPPTLRMCVLWGGCPNCCLVTHGARQISPQVCSAPRRRSPPPASRA